MHDAVNFLLTLILLSSGVHAFLFSSKGFSVWNNKPIDCAWLPWEYAGCVSNHNGSLRKVETRGKIHAQHEGKDCDPEPDSRISNVECSDTEFITTAIFKSLGGIRKETKPIGFSFSPLSTLDLSTVDVRKTFKDYDCKTRNFIASTGVKLIGKDCGGFRKKRQTSPFAGEVESIEHRDILFLIDGSGSIGEVKFKQELEFVKVLAKKFCDQREISPDRTRVALTTFGSDHSHPIKFKDHKSYRSFKKSLKQEKPLGGGTCVLNALDSVRKEMFTEASGSRVNTGNANGERNADGVIVIVTDG